MNKNSPRYVLGYMTVLCAVFGTGVSVVHYSTRDMLAANERLHHNRVICDAYDLPVAGRAPADYERAMQEHLEVAEADGQATDRRVYRRRDDDSGWIGFPISGMGFWDRIEGFITLDAERARIMRLRFFDHSETPGLGGRIEEPEFLDQFDRLEIAWDAPEPERILIGAGPAREQPNRVDAITGATRTSEAVIDFLNRELERIRAIDIDALEFRPMYESET